MKQIRLFLLAMLTVFFTACGGGSSDDNGSTDAQDILEGKTFYYTDEYLDFSDGYYKDYFGATTLTETEHMADGTVLYTYNIHIKYSGSDLIVDYNGDDETCSVERYQKSVEIYCPVNGYTQVLWDTIEDAKANPQP